MSRQSKPKAQTKPADPAAEQSTAKPDAAATTSEAQTALQTADQAVVTQSTLGDGDATGAAAQAPSAAAASQAPAPDVVNPKAHAKGHVVRVVGPAKGRWRAGRKFGPEPVEIPASELTAEDLAKLEGDPELAVSLVEA